MEIKRVSIIGLGALGILFGHHLARRLPREDVRIIADQNRIRRYEAEGVFCNGEKCQFHYVTPEELVEPADLLIFAVKIHGLQEAIEMVKNHVGDHTIILSALNGITSEAMIGEQYGMEKLLYCVAQGMDAVKVGNQLTYDHMGMLVFGDWQPHKISEKTLAVVDFFTKTGLPYQVDSKMQKRLWGKFMLNVGVNQTVAVYKSNYGEIQKDGPARDMMIGAMREVMEISEKEDVHLTEDDLHYWLDVLSTLSPNGKPSMAQDVDAKRLTEVELFSGTVIAYGKKHGIQTPINQKLYEVIKGEEASLR